MNEINWSLKPFDKLSAKELYEILKLRSEVFVVEQNCVYLDIDDKDQASWHLTGAVHDEIVAYVRILPPGLAFVETSIGRVLTKMSYRKNGAGILLMKEAIAHAFSLYNCSSIRIGAQLYLQKFYSNLGFTQCSDVYLEDNIPHIEMLLAK